MKILDILINTPLFEMAYERKRAKDLVSDLSPNIMDHMIKLFVMNSPETKNHWISEINSWLFKIDAITLKPKNKRPQKSDIYDWLLIDNVPTYDASYIHRKIKHWKNSEYSSFAYNDVDPVFIMNKIKQILERVCVDISADKFFGIQDYLNL
jgi:hypothetical protein